MAAQQRKRQSASLGVRSMQEPLAGPVRAIFALITSAAAALILFSGSALMSSLYVKVVDSALQGVRWKSDILALSQRAIDLAPWRSAPRMQQAQLISTTRQLDRAVDAASSALERSPADARHWAYWARLRGAADRYDHAMLGGYRLAVAWAPHAWNVRESIALDGVMRWRHGDEDIRQVWSDSITFTLYRRGDEFKRQIIHYGRDPYFCATAGKRLPVQDWCALAARTRANCASAKIKAAGIAWCQRNGFPTREVKP